MRRTLLAFVVGCFIAMGMVSLTYSNKPVEVVIPHHSKIFPDLKPKLAFYQTKKMELSNKEFHCLALNLYHEARGEGILGMIGVGQVTLNRVQTQYRGKKSVCGVVYDSKQFSWTNAPTKKPVITKEVLAAARLVADGLRITQLTNVLHYHADYVSPKWSEQMTVSIVMGQHLFLEKKNA